MTTTASVAEAKDPVCGMAVDSKNAPHADRDGQTFYFCCEQCRSTFLKAARDGVPLRKAGDGCCD